MTQTSTFCLRWVNVFGCVSRGWLFILESHQDSVRPKEMEDSQFCIMSFLSSHKQALISFTNPYICVYDVHVHWSYHCNFFPIYTLRNCGSVAPLTIHRLIWIVYLFKDKLHSVNIKHTQIFAPWKFTLFTLKKLSIKSYHPHWRTSSLL